MISARFITFEGLDACGKSTQAKRLAKRLQESGHSVLLLREPGASPVGERIRSILLDPEVSMEPLTEAMLFNASRAELVARTIRPALESGTIVICDRFFDSTLAYQGYGRQMPLESLRILCHLATGGLIPDRTYYIHIPVAEMIRRKQGQGKDRMESADMDFYVRVTKGFLTLALGEPARFRVIDGLKTPEEIHEQIWLDLNA